MRVQREWSPSSLCVGISGPDRADQIRQFRWSQVGRCDLVNVEVFEEPSPQALGGIGQAENMNLTVVGCRNVGRSHEAHHVVDYQDVVRSMGRMEQRAHADDHLDREVSGVLPAVRPEVGAPRGFGSGKCNQDHAGHQIVAPVRPLPEVSFNQKPASWVGFSPSDRTTCTLFVPLDASAVAIRRAVALPTARVRK